MGLDVGKKRIGVAISDELLITAQGMESIECDTPQGDIEKIAGLVGKNDVGEIVVGLPLSMDGTESAQTKEVIAFCERLSKALKIPVKTWDERLTSVQADRILLEADMSRRKRRRLSDRLAAQLILQGYLDSRKA
jgi:putative Holliday junction resolvase